MFPVLNSNRIDEIISEIYHNRQYDDVVFVDRGIVHVGFRRMVLALNKEVFYTWLCLLRKISESVVWSATQTILIDIPFSDISILVDESELKRLLIMMETAHDHIRTRLKMCDC